MDELNLLKWQKKKRQRERREEKRKKREQLTPKKNDYNSKFDASKGTEEIKNNSDHEKNSPLTIREESPSRDQSSLRRKHKRSKEKPEKRHQRIPAKNTKSYHSPKLYISSDEGTRKNKILSKNKSATSSERKSKSIGRSSFGSDVYSPLKSEALSFSPGHKVSTESQDFHSGTSLSSSSGISPKFGKSCSPSHRRHELIDPQKSVWEDSTDDESIDLMKAAKSLKMKREKYEKQEEKSKKKKEKNEGTKKTKEKSIGDLKITLFRDDDMDDFDQKYTNYNYIKTKQKNSEWSRARRKSEKSNNLLTTGDKLAKYEREEHTESIKSTPKGKALKIDNLEIDTSNDSTTKKSPSIEVEKVKRKGEVKQSQESYATCSLEAEEVTDDPDRNGNQTPAKPVKHASLWSDSEDENKEQHQKENSTGKKRKRKYLEDTSQKSLRSPSRRQSRSSKSRSYEEMDNNEEEIDAQELKPFFNNPKFGPFELTPLVMECTNGECRVPGAINRYLREYQREGIVFMHNRVVKQDGAILGDDMGLGKTVQVISLLSALLDKNGSGEDNIELRRRRKLNQEKLEMFRKVKENALREGIVTHTRVEGLIIPKWSPILVVVPASVVENWLNEFKTWGYFGAVKFTGASRDRAFEDIKNGLADIMICCKSIFQQSEDFRRIKDSLKWKLIVVDEYHQYKNFRTISYKGLKSLKEVCGAPLLGLTGTLMQNNHEELWSLVDLVNPGFLGTWEEFKDDAAVPIKMGRSKTADEDTIDKSEEVRQWLTKRLKSFYIQRLKSIELKDYLPNKSERVLFCELSPLQKSLYEHILSLPDYVLLKFANSPCECGVNQKIFLGYKRMRTEAEKLAYQRNNRDSIIPRKKCCHVKPLNPLRFDTGEELYDPRAPLWRWQHQHLVNESNIGEDKGCKMCPYCIGFAALDKLYKLSSHVALLQVPKHPDNFTKGSRAWKDAQKAFDFASVAFPDNILRLLPGGSSLRQDGIMNDHANLSGKMKVLAEILVEFDRKGDRLLIFSFSTQTLDLIQNFVKAEGYSFLRLDGTTNPGARQGLVDKYQKDESIFLFLISTKAGGLGLNLSAANVIIVFDVDFNPSNDEQSQDRAYRIGQKRDVLVIRLVARGTIEEIKYIRQIYKVQLRKDTIGSIHNGAIQKGEGPRVFRGVHGDKDRKGELFGMENLLKYKDGSFMDDLWKSARTEKSVKGLEKFGLRSKEEMMKNLESLSQTEVNDIGGNIEETRFKEVAEKIAIAEDNVSAFLRGENLKDHQDFLRADMGDAILKPGDEGFEEEMGGCSQAANYIMENASIYDEIPTADLNESRSSKAVPISNKSKYRSLDISPTSAKKAKRSNLRTEECMIAKSNTTLEYMDRKKMKKKPTAKISDQSCIDTYQERKPSKKETKKTRTKTTFTAKDLYLPQYVKKKRKKS